MDGIFRYVFWTISVSVIGMGSFLFVESISFNKTIAKAEWTLKIAEQDQEKLEIYLRFLEQYLKAHDSI